MSISRNTLKSLNRDSILYRTLGEHRMYSKFIRTEALYTTLICCNVKGKEIYSEKPHHVYTEHDFIPNYTLNE